MLRRLSSRIWNVANNFVRFSILYTLIYNNADALLCSKLHFNFCNNNEVQIAEIVKPSHTVRFEYF